MPSVTEEPVLQVPIDTHLVDDNLSSSESSVVPCSTSHLTVEKSPSSAVTCFDATLSMRSLPHSVTSRLVLMLLQMFLSLYMEFVLILIL